MKLLNTHLQLTGDPQDIIAMHINNLFLTFPLNEINTKNYECSRHIQNLVLTYGESLVKAELTYKLTTMKQKVG